ncbi:hypothetical protein DER44DRAFT_803788 [Fusarium oxysporum]|nr:hypothetical protein DER44DRAFT_803788 [Fusarium oxysporum]
MNDDDTEPDVVLAPGSYWTKYLWSKLDKLAKKKLPSNRTFHVDDTDIAVCVNYRGETDLITRSDGLDINWMIETFPLTMSRPASRVVLSHVAEVAGAPLLPSLPRGP